MTRYHPNFIRGRKNILPKGKDLKIKIEDDPLYIIGQLFKRKSLFRKSLIQIEQTGTKQNPEKDKITFEMKVRTPDGTKPMIPGKYKVITYAYFVGLGGKRWKDNFEIE